MDNRRAAGRNDGSQAEECPGPGEDPRLGRDRIRTVEGEQGDLTLLGVVHEHPASVHRARTVVHERAPDVLALELPPMAIPLFVEHATGDRDPPAYGGEMSAAIQAAQTDHVVGIDGPSLPFLVTLATTLVRERPEREALRGVFAGLAAASREAAASCIAGAISSRTSLDVAVGSPVTHDCGHHDDPAVQAADEDGQIRRARAVMDAVEPSRASQFRDAIREAHMADRLSALGSTGNVVAVVGYGHLDALADRLDATADG